MFRRKKDAEELSCGFEVKVFFSEEFYKADKQYISEISFVNYKKCIYLPQI